MFELAATSSIARLTMLIVIFGLVVTGAFALMTFLTRRALVRSELRELTKNSLLVPSRSEGLRSSTDTAWSKLADAVEKAGLNLGDTKSDRLRTKLIAAGYSAPSAPRIFTLIRLALVFILPLGYILIAY